jgi:hypothetical protein
MALMYIVAHSQILRRKRHGINPEGLKKAGKPSPGHPWRQTHKGRRGNMEKAPPLPLSSVAAAGEARKRP